MTTAPFDAKANYKKFLNRIGTAGDQYKSWTDYYDWVTLNFLKKALTFPIGSKELDT